MIPFIFFLMSNKIFFLNTIQLSSYYVLIINLNILKNYRRWREVVVNNKINSLEVDTSTHQFSTYQNPDTTRSTNIISSVHIRTHIPPDLQTLSVQYISEPRYHQIYKHYKFSTDNNPDTTRSTNIISSVQIRTHTPPDLQTLSVQYR